MTDRERVVLPRVLAVLESFHTSAEIYILRPLRALAQQGRIQFNARLESQASPGRLAWADLVVYGRNVTIESHPLFEEVISRGIPSVYVLDDNFWDLPAELKLDEVYRKSHQIRQLERYVRYASRVKVFSPFLAEKVRPFNPAVLLDTPCIDFSLLPVGLPPRDPQKVKITYVTARGSKDPFLALFTDDLRALLQNIHSRWNSISLVKCSSLLPICPMLAASRSNGITRASSTAWLKVVLISAWHR
jgi:hypothetical protein